MLPGGCAGHRVLRPVRGTGARLLAHGGRPALLRAYRANAEALGRHFDADDAGTPLPTFSTDMANVSLAVPTIHPLIGIETHGAVNHQRVHRRLRHTVGRRRRA